MQPAIKKIALSVSVLLFIYVVLRAALIPFVYDEIYTFLFHIQTGSIQPFYARMDANNHVINSLAAHLSYLAFGKNLLSLRLPNVLAFVLFLWYLFKIDSHFNDRRLWFMLFSSLVFCHFMLDFFSLCRGYGLSIGFMTGCIYHALNFNRSGNLVDLALTCIFLSLAMWSNLGLIVFAIAVIGLLLIIIVKHRIINQSIGKSIMGVLVLVLLFVLPFLYATYYSLALKEAGALYFGSNLGLWGATFESLAYSISDGQFWRRPFLYLSLLAYGTSLILNLNHRPSWTKIVVNGMFLSTIIGTVLMHHLLGVKYPLDRGTLHLIPLFFLALFLNFDGVKNKFRYISLMFPLVLFIHFVSNVNLSYSLRWKSDVVPTEFFDHIRAHQVERGSSPTVSTNVFQGFSLSFTDALSDSHMNPCVEPTHPSLYADFIIHTPTIDRIALSEIDLSRYDTIQYKSEVPTVLLARTAETQSQVISNVNVAAVTSGNQFIDIANINVDSVITKGAYRVDIELTVQAAFKPLKWWICTRYDGEDQSLGFHYSDLQMSTEDISQGQTIRVTHLVEKELDKIKALKVYIHNHHNRQIEITEGSVLVSTVQ